MKNVILLDISCTLVKTISQMEDINVEVAIIGEADDKNINIDTGKFKEFYLYRGYDKKLDFYFNLNNKKLDLTYEEIEKFRHLQLEVEHFFLRTNNDISLSQNKYYQALSYWLNIFKTKKIDYVISPTIYHGELEEMAISIAKSFNVKVLVIETFSEMNSYYFYGVLNWNTKKYISIEDCSDSLSRVNKNDVSFFPNKGDIYENSIINTSYSTVFHKILYELVGVIFTFSIIKILGRYNITFLGSKIPLRVYFSGYFHNKSLIRYYNKNSIKKRKNEKYLYYSMTFDPEAVTLARSCVSSQLTLIKMLAESVPDDVFIYVKDHPAYTMLNTATYSYFLINNKNFRSKSYYDELLKMRNVKLINMNESSEDLVKNSLALCTITGSVIVETIFKYKKPIIMFDSKLSPMGMIKDIFKVRSTNDCKQALKIICSDFVPTYNDFDSILKKYAFKAYSGTRDLMGKNDLRCLLKEIDKSSLDKSENNNIK